MIIITIRDEILSKKSESLLICSTETWSVYKRNISKVFAYPQVLSKYDSRSVQNSGDLVKLYIGKIHNYSLFECLTETAATARRFLNSTAPKYAKRARKIYNYPLHIVLRFIFWKEGKIQTVLLDAISTVQCVGWKAHCLPWLTPQSWTSCGRRSRGTSLAASCPGPRATRAGTHM